MRSHLSPNSSGSAPASRRAFSSSIGSGSSGRGGHSADRSASSMSLSRSASFSSDARRRRLVPTSPALSAFGRGSPSDGGSGNVYLPSMRPLSPLGLSTEDTNARISSVERSSDSGSPTVVESRTPTIAARATIDGEDRWITATPGLRWVNPLHPHPSETDISD
jgi:hypothetical protein